MLTGRGWEGTDGESAQTSSAAEALDVDQEVGAGAPAPELKGAEMQHTLLTGVMAIGFSTRAIVKNSSSSWEPEIPPSPAALPCLSTQLGQPLCSALASLAMDEAERLTLWLPATRSQLAAHPRTRSMSCHLWQLPLLTNSYCFSLTGITGSFQDAPFCFLCSPGISLINSICAGSVMSIWLQAFISTAGCAQHDMLPLSL